MNQLARPLPLVVNERVAVWRAIDEHLSLDPLRDCLAKNFGGSISRDLFDPSDDDPDTYLFGGAVTCAAPLEPFIPGENESLGVAQLEFLGLLLN